MNNGFVRVAAAIPDLRVGDCKYNVARIADLVKQAEAEKVQVVCFPELCITGYTCGDLFMQERLLSDALAGLNELQLLSFSVTGALIVGLPLRIGHRLFNVAAVLQGGHILGIVPKTHLPNQHEYYEKRWFTSALDARVDKVKLSGEEIPFGTKLLFTDAKFSFSIEICEDVWMPVPPSSVHAVNGAEVIFNLSASNELIGKNAYRRQLIEQQSARCNAGYVYVSAGAGESTTDMVFTGNAFIVENGKMLEMADRFSFEPQLITTDIDIERLVADRMRNTNFDHDVEAGGYRVIRLEDARFTQFELKRTFNKHPFVPPLTDRDEHCSEIFSIQVGGLAKRWKHTGAETMVVGISGGLDSTLALMVAVKTADKLSFDRKRVVGITMPGFGTTGRTYNNALKLMQSLGITVLEIPIGEASKLHFKDIGHDPENHNIVYENTQARERTQVLMDVANQRNGLVIGTGDLSELALGWATYNGDHMSMYAVNSGVPKTLVRYLVDWSAHQVDASSAEVLRDIIDTPVSPELLPADENGEIAQKTEDLVGPYELHDFFLYYLVRFGFSPERIYFLAKQAFVDDYPEETIRKWLKVFLKRFFAQQFKRSCMPDGPKVGSINLSPRGDWRMPSDAVAFEIPLTPKGE